MSTRAAGTATAKTPAAGAVAEREEEPKGGKRRFTLRGSKKRPIWLRLTVIDGIVVLAAVGAIVLSSMGAVKTAGEPRAILSNGTDEWVYPLDKDRIIPVQGPLGITTVHIHAGAVCIEDSPCPNKTCVASGSISEPGQWVACLPNQVFVRVEGGSHNEPSIDSNSW